MDDNDEITDQDVNGQEHRKFPPLLPEDASNDDMIKAINGLAVEQQLTRQAVQELGSRIATALRRLDAANGL